MLLQRSEPSAVSPQQPLHPHSAVQDRPRTKTKRKNMLQLTGLAESQAALNHIWPYSNSLSGPGRGAAGDVALTAHARVGWLPSFSNSSSKVGRMRPPFHLQARASPESTGTMACLQCLTNTNYSTNHSSGKGCLLQEEDTVDPIPSTHESRRL